MRRRLPRLGGALLAGLVYLVLGVATLASRDADRLPVTTDSRAYLEAASGVGACLRAPLRTAGKIFGGGFTEEEKEELGLDGWILQHAPVYVLSLGVSEALGGGETGARAVSVVYLALLGALLYDLGRRLFHPLVGAAAAILLLLDPATLTYGTAVLTEIPLAAILVFACWALVLARERTTPARCFVLGLALGILFFGKVTFRPLVPLVLVGAVLSFRSRGRAPAGAAAVPGSPSRRRLAMFLAAGTAAVLLPWFTGLALARLPAHTLSEPGNAAMWLYRGNNLRLQGWETVGAGDAFTPELLASLEEVEAGGETPWTAYRKAFWRQVGSSPMAWLSLAGRKFALFFSQPSIKGYTRTPLWTMPPWLALYPIAVVAALLGWILCIGSRHAWPPGLLVLYLAAAHAFSHLVSRYNAPAIPLVYLYAAAAPWVVLRAPWLAPRRRPAAGTLWALAMLASGITLCLFARFVTSHPPWAPSPRGLATLSWASAVSGAACVLLMGVLGGALSGWLAKTASVRRRLAGGFLAAGLAGAALMLCLRGSDPDWDEFSVKLERAGDRVVQRIGTAPLRAHPSIEEAWLAMDLLRSIDRDFALEVRINDRPARLFEGDLGARPEHFILDPGIHGGQNRHLRVLRTLEEDVRTLFVPRYGSRSPGLDGVRRWVRIPVLPEDLRDRDSVTVTLLMKRCGRDAFVEVFGDQALPARGDRRFKGPAFFINAYLQSNYRYRMLSGDRRRADYRLCFETPLTSPWARSSFRDAMEGREDLSREPGVQVGEYRLRLRVKLPGRHVFRVAGPAPVIVWTDETLPGDRVLTAKELNFERARYFDHFDGFVTY